VGIVVAVVLAVVLAATYVTWLAGRLDRLHVRCEAARAALDAQLVRRAAAARALADSGRLTPPAATGLHAAADLALAAGPAERETVENALGRQLRAVLAGAPPDPDLEATLTKVALARAFHNDAVRDTRTLRDRRVVRWLRLAGHAPAPAYFEIDTESEPDPRRSMVELPHQR
jgi:hypothetical protein